MKYTLIIILCLISNLVLSQTKGGNKELYLQTYEVSTNSDSEFRVTLEAIGKVWNNDFQIATSYYSYSDGKYHDLTYSKDTVFGEYDQTSNLYGWDHLGGLEGGEFPPFFGYAVYKITMEHSSTESKRTFYYDLRDSDYLNLPGASSYGCSNDSWIKYYGEAEGNDEKFILNGGAGCPDYEITQENNYSYYSVWDVHNATNEHGDPKLPQTANFEDFWENSLVLIKKNNHPRLV